MQPTCYENNRTDWNYHVFLSLILRVLFKAELERKNALYFSILEKKNIQTLDKKLKEIEIENN